MKKNFKVVFFDMGNTLLHFHHGKSDHEKDIIGLNYLTSFLQEINSKILLDDVRKDFFESWQKVMPLRKVNHIEYPVEDYLNNSMKKYGVNLSIDMCIKAIDVFYTEYRNNVWIEEEIHQTLDNIRNKGYKIGIISNSSLYDEVMINCFKKVELDRYIDTYTFSYYLKIGKPKKEVFEVALNRMNVRPNEAVMVGDNLVSDIKPAQDLGLTGVWFNKNQISNNKPIKPDFEIAYLKELRDLL